MFAQFLEIFLKENNIKPDKITDRYVRFMGRDCFIYIDFHSRVRVSHKGKFLKYFKFDEKKIRQYL